MYTVIFQSSHISGLDRRDFLNEKELNTFLKDKDEEICSTGDARQYFVIEGAQKISKGEIERT